MLARVTAVAMICLTTLPAQAQTPPACMGALSESDAAACSGEVISFCNELAGTMTADQGPQLNAVCLANLAMTWRTWLEFQSGTSSLASSINSNLSAAVGGDGESASADSGSQTGAASGADEDTASTRAAARLAAECGDLERMPTPEPATDITAMMITHSSCALGVLGDEIEAFKAKR